MNQSFYVLIQDFNLLPILQHCCCPLILFQFSFKTDIINNCILKKKMNINRYLKKRDCKLFPNFLKFIKKYIETLLNILHNVDLICLQFFTFPQYPELSIMNQSSKFHLHTDLQRTQVRIDIKRLIDQNHVLKNQSEPNCINEIYFTMDLISHGQAYSPRKYSKVYPKKLELNEPIIFDWKYQDLSPWSRIAITIWSSAKKYNARRPLGSTVISIFDQRECLRQGKYHLFIWPDVLPDLDMPSTTPGLTDDPNIATLNFVADKKENIVNRNIHDQRVEEALNIKLFYTYRLIPAAFLEVEFPKFPYPIFFADKLSLEYEDFLDKNLNAVKTTDFNDCFQIYDPDFEAERPDPLQETFYFLKRQNQLNPQKLLPNRQETKLIDSIVNRTFKADGLKPQEKQLFIKYRYYLAQDRRYLIHYLHSVQWGTHQESDAIKLLGIWQKIDWPDALHLLSKQFAANTTHNKKKSRSHATMKIIRDYATEIISSLQGESFTSILLQLIQTIRYDAVGDSSMARLINDKALENKQIAVFAYWYLCTQAEPVKEAQGTKISKEAANLLAQNTQIYKNTFHLFCEELEAKDAEAWKMIVQQKRLLKYLKDLSKLIKQTSKNQRDQQYRKRLAEKDWEQMGPIPFPIDISLVLKAPIPNQCSIFSSAMAPFKLTFELVNGGKYSFMYKNGDDLRQDQLILELFALMDKVLKNVNQDYKLTPYKALACSKSDGFVEFVARTRTFQSIELKEHLRKLIQNKSEAMENYVFSTAGYCAITYFFMIGDRHLENLLIDEEGKIFHIDFGFILGRDPKPYPPPIKISKEMIDAMGANQQQKQENFKKFKLKCLQAYLYLRKQAKLVYNLTTLMLDSGIKDVHNEGLSKLYDKFSISLNDKQAEKYFLLVLQECRNALFPNIADRIHIWATYFRK